MQIRAAAARGRVAGWAATSEYSARDVYAGVAECSVYVDPQFRGRGIGSALLAALGEECGRRGFHKLIGKLFESNEASIRLVERGGSAWSAPISAMERWTANGGT